MKEYIKEFCEAAEALNSMGLNPSLFGPARRGDDNLLLKVIKSRRGCEFFENFRADVLKWLRSCYGNDFWEVEKLYFEFYVLAVAVHKLEAFSKGFETFVKAQDEGKTQLEGGW